MSEIGIGFAEPNLRNICAARLIAGTVNALTALALDGLPGRLDGRARRPSGLCAQSIRSIVSSIESNDSGDRVEAVSPASLSTQSIGEISLIRRVEVVRPSGRSRQAARPAHSGHRVYPTNP